MTGDANKDAAVAFLGFDGMSGSGVVRVGDGEGGEEAGGDIRRVDRGHCTLKVGFFMLVALFPQEDLEWVDG